MVRAIIYARVSTNVQEDNYSLDTQIAACRTYASLNNMYVVKEFYEVESAGTLNRSELNKVRSLIQNGEADILIVHSLDRLVRKLSDNIFLREELKKHNATVHYATRGASNIDASGELLDNIEGAFAEFERHRIKERLMRGREAKIKGTADKAARIYGNGNCPYGYAFEGRKKDRKQVIHDIEAIAVRNMYRLSLAGIGVHTIADRLNEEGVPTPAQLGRAAGNIKRENPIWTGAMVHRILTNEVYAGMKYHNRTHRVGTRDIRVPREEWIGVPVPEIIDRETFDAVQEHLANGRRGSRRNAKHFYLLGRGKLKCVCGYTMTGGTQGSTKYPWRSYRCHHYNGEAIRPCTLGAIKADVIEGLLWNWLYSVLTPEAIQEGIKAHHVMTTSERVTLEQRITSLDKRRITLERESEKMIMAYKAGIISLHELSKDKAFVDVERKQIDQEYARLNELQRETVWHDAEALMAEAAELRAYMPRMNDEEKAKLLDRLYFKAERRLNLVDEQIIYVECRLGSESISLSASSTPILETPTHTPQSLLGKRTIESASYSSR